MGDGYAAPLLQPACLRSSSWAFICICVPPIGALIDPHACTGEEGEEGTRSPCMGVPGQTTRGAGTPPSAFLSLAATVRSPSSSPGPVFPLHHTSSKDGAHTRGPHPGGSVPHCHGTHLILQWQGCQAARAPLGCCCPPSGQPGLRLQAPPVEPGPAMRDEGQFGAAAARSVPQQQRGRGPENPSAAVNAAFLAWKTKRSGKPAWQG